MSSIPCFNQSCNQLTSASPLHLLGKQRWASHFLEVSLFVPIYYLRANNSYISYCKNITRRLLMRNEKNSRKT